MTEETRAELAARLEGIRAAGTFKEERVIQGPQGPRVTVGGRELINLCANNYLGLSSDPRVVQAAQEALDRWGFGTSSVRFICGTQEIHRELERRLSAFLGTEDTILYSSCFDANGGVFEPLLDAECALLSDSLNHASLIDGARLCKAERLVYAHADMADLEAKLQAAAGARIRMIVTDGVFSMDGDMAPLPELCALAERHGALLAVDDSHATGFVGATGRGTAEHFGVRGALDAVTTTFGKALGGATGGCVSGRKEIVDLLRQRSRPYLFSNSLAPAVAGATLAVLDILERGTELRDRLERNTSLFRAALSAAGFALREGNHPIVAVILGDERRTMEMARLLLEDGVYAAGFSHPVVPRGQARIRAQVSAAHSEDDLRRAAEAFSRAGKRLGVV
jgi:glycine C-acetyltransferase